MATRKTAMLFAAAAALAAVACSSGRTADYAGTVNPLIGTDFTGNTFRARAQETCMTSLSCL